MAEPGSSAIAAAMSSSARPGSATPVLKTIGVVFRSAADPVPGPRRLPRETT